jgi:hypothetical protein
MTHLESVAKVGVGVVVVDSAITSIVAVQPTVQETVELEAYPVHVAVCYHRPEVPIQGVCGQEVLQGTRQAGFVGWQELLSGWPQKSRDTAHHCRQQEPADVTPAAASNVHLQAVDYRAKR